MMKSGMDLISIHDLSVGDVEEILALAADLKARQKAGIPHPLLAGKTLGMIFEKSSTRTRGYGARPLSLSRRHHDPHLWA